MESKRLKQLQRPYLSKQVRKPQYYIEYHKRPGNPFLAFLVGLVFLSLMYFIAFG